MEKVKFQLSAAEDDLWHQVVVRLLEQRDVDEEQAKDHLRLLEELAFHHRFCGKPLTRTFAEDTATWLAEEKKFSGPRDKAQEWLRDLERWELLLRRSSGDDTTYEFPIPGLDEYFAARHLAARWAEETKRYQVWLPSRKGWWRRSKKLACTNPHCLATLPPFRGLFCEAEHEETLLLMTGLLKDARHEELVLKEFYDDLNLLLKIFSRCRHDHPVMFQAIFDELSKTPVIRIRTGLAALGRARAWENLLNAVVAKYRNDLWYADRGVQWAAAWALREIANIAAIEVLMRQLEGGDLLLGKQIIAHLVEIGNPIAAKSFAVVLDPWWMWNVYNDDADLRWEVKECAAWALKELGEPALEVLIAALTGEEILIKAAWGLAEIRGARAAEPLVIQALRNCDYVVRKKAADVLGSIGGEQAIPALHMLSDDPVKQVRDAAQRALEEIERRTGSKSGADT